MFIDARTIADDTIIEADICIIGTGAAGIPLALELESQQKSICVLESGALENQTELDALYEFGTTGLPISPKSRTQGFGGTTQVWAGIWKLHDQIDFAARPWVPHSGWPIGREDLDAYYERAAKLVQAPSPEAFGPHENLFARSTVNPTIVRRMDQDKINFAKVFYTRFEQSSNIQVYFNAVALNLPAGAANSGVENVAVKTFAGNAFRVNAKVFILACGGIENARLLLLSGIGNESDQVGRYYMDHPKGKVGTIRLSDQNLDLSGFWDGYDQFGQYFIGLGLSEQIQKHEQVLNSYVQLQPNFGRSSIFAKFIRKIVNPKPVSISLRNFMEQEPNPENRIALGQTRDAFGRPRAEIFWSVSNLEKKTMRILHETLKAELNRMKIGDLESPLLDETAAEWPIKTDASHHMGTTRMGTEPKTSVVDQNCKVHTLNNLYVAGSSLFPTAGYAHPTATIIALAIRLADHIKSNA
jgi:choline dehydrogenase-like flavoprotein